MKDIQAAPGEGENHSQVQGPIQVWDLPVRLVHWLMVFCFAGAYLTAEMDAWRLVHVTLGYTMAALVCFRLGWGFFGTYHARFSSFVRGPRATLAYLRSLPSGRPQHFTGHNPAGAVAILLMLAIALALTASGWLLYAEKAGAWMEEVHELIANLMLAVIALHVVGVLVASRLHRENLVKAMFTGRKRGVQAGPAQGPGLRGGIAFLLLLLVLGFWWWQGSGADIPGDGEVAASRERSHAGAEDD